MTALPPFGGSYGYPGMTDVIASVENNFHSGRVIDMFLEDAMISGAARDAGNTDNTTFLRPGLLMGFNASTQIWTQWDPTATDGTEVLRGINTIGHEMQPDGANTNRYFNVLTWGTLKADGLLIPGESSFGLSGKDQEFAVVNALLDGGFRLDDKYQRGFSTHKSVTATATLTSIDIGKTISDYGASGNTAITLPAPKAGMELRFVAVTANTRTISTPTADKLISVGDAAADSIALAQGDTCDLATVQTGAAAWQWMVISHLGGTVAT